MAVTVAGRTTSVGVAPGQAAVTAVVTVPDVDLWWPTGYGDQARYGLKLDLVSTTDP